MNIPLITAAALVSVLTSCVDYVDAPRRSYTRSGSYHPNGPGLTDNYVYYPEQQIYYSSQRRHYIYQEGNTWVTRDSPRVSPQLLINAPSVQLDFHDSPQAHHANVVRRYPKHRSSGPAYQSGRDPREAWSDDDRDHHH